MCGLVGVAGVIGQKEKEALKTLLVIDTLRGHHSTGVASVSGTGDWRVAKKKGNAWDLFDSRDYTETMTPLSYCLIGHNRAATKGKVNNINAHPFEFKDVVGCHNGTLRGQFRLPDYQRFEVDSENIFYSIQQQGLEDTLKILDGAYALTYWDKRTEELTLLRNNERTLFYAFTEDRKTLMWASEAWMITVAAARHRIKVKQVFDVTPCTIHRFTLDRRFQADEIRLETEEFEEFVAPKPPVTNGVWNGYGATAAKKPTGDAGKPPGPNVGQSGGQSAGGLSNETCRRLLKTYQEFEVEGHKKTATGQEYVEGRLKAYPEATIRVFAKPNTKLWNDLVVNYDSVFKAELSSFYHMNGMTAFTANIASVVMIEEEEDEEEDTFLGFNNKLLTEEEFAKKTVHGCAWCTSPVSTLDAKFIKWVADDSFVCVDCQELEEVKSYIQSV